MLLGGGGLTSKVATGVTWWRRLNLEGGDGCYSVAAAQSRRWRRVLLSGGGLASNMFRWL